MFEKNKPERLNKRHFAIFRKLLLALHLAMTKLLSQMRWNIYMKYVELRKKRMGLRYIYPYLHLTKIQVSNNVIWNISVLISYLSLAYTYTDLRFWNPYEIICVLVEEIILEILIWLTDWIENVNLRLISGPF